MIAPLIELHYALKQIEERMKDYYPPTCKYEKIYNALNEIRNQYIKAIKILEGYENN